MSSTIEHRSQTFLIKDDHLKLLKASVVAWSSQWDGSMSDVRLYNRVLTAAEVHTLYAATQRI